MSLWKTTWYFDFQARTLHTECLQNLVIFSSFCLFLSPRETLAKHQSNNQTSTGKERKQLTSRLVISNLNLEGGTWEVPLMQLDSSAHRMSRVVSEIEFSVSARGREDIHSIFGQTKQGHMWSSCKSRHPSALRDQHRNKSASPSDDS